MNRADTAHIAAIPRVWCITVTGSAWLNSNRRMNHYARNRLVQEWRTSAGWATKAARIPRITVPVHITCYVRYRDRRRHDVGNWYPTAKAAIDGIVSAGVLRDDSDDHVTGPDMRVSGQLAKVPTIDLWITEAVTG